MKSSRNILIAFLINLIFSIFEFVGGIITNSNAIISDSIHDMGDALSIGVNYILERISKKKPDSKYTYGYTRYSVFGSLITVLVLVISSILVISHSITKIINPVEINYNGMFIFAIIGIIANSVAGIITKKGNTLSQDVVSLHMFEDVFGWIVVLFSALIMKFTDLTIIDPILSILLALYIMFEAIKHMKTIMDLLLEKIPREIELDEIKHHLCEIDGVKDIHHVHVWSMDGQNNYATLHVVVDEFNKNIKDKVREELKEYGINHVTLELEIGEEHCHNEHCEIVYEVQEHHHHHHH